MSWGRSFQYYKLKYIWANFWKFPFKWRFMANYQTFSRNIFEIYFFRIWANSCNHWTWRFVNDHERGRRSCFSQCLWPLHWSMGPTKCEKRRSQHYRYILQQVRYVIYKFEDVVLILQNSYYLADIKVRTIWTTFCSKNFHLNFHTFFASHLLKITNFFTEILLAVMMLILQPMVSSLLLKWP